MRLVLAVALMISAPTRQKADAQKNHDIEIVALDYAFQVPARVVAGPTTMHFVNRGKVAHELNVVLLRRGATMQEFVAASNGGQPLASLIEGTVGVVFAAPGTGAAARLVTDLQPGREYALRCVLRDSASAPRHYMLGMYASIHVDGTRAPETATVRADTIVGMDYAFRAPTRLTPGRHRLAFVNEGKQRHEVYLALLKPDVRLQQVMGDASAGRFPTESFDARLGVLHTPGGSSPVGVLEVDLQPGREYLIVCTFADSPTSPQHMTLGMLGGIAVDGAARSEKR